MWRVLLSVVMILAPPAARACDVALLLAVDVSSSIDAAEYRLQIDGMADAFADPEIAARLVEGQIAVAVLQWSGPEAQALSLPWQRMTDPAAVRALAQRTRLLPRAFTLSGTAPGDAIHAALGHLRVGPACARQVIDISGDGTANAGLAPAPARRAAERAGVTINGIAIEHMGLSLTNYYRWRLTTADGFVVTARGHRDYPRAIRAKILREISKILG
ncbi:hypothetical protein CBW24_06645 [Pacificitalea manganoxidans]|uniref:Ca-activated chloride channel family protein n=1 Tax=Pacificitalea manganoxidans TaxID=1411902 RepID=A0A291LYK4_9RHOB|nr:DUF1194 domain-containing protein [Pacificitalea manganoxidans]ATI41707.1 hypothetical protein CBW24_06645 [Pacificitalea manganoxidans]MDR6309160.1 Ca-activated chloride channel family protein [Pacificitalea manganoxidans]